MQYEYKKLVISKLYDMEVELYEVGEQSWEIVCLLTENESYYTFLAKRAKTTPA